MALFESAQDSLEYNQLLELLSQGVNTAASRPKAVLFGDSMSEYVGYNPDGSVDTRYGQSVADVLSQNLGIPVQNLATGGETSYEALAGSGQKFGGFADFITQNRPEYAILRYGAADAIKSQDPQKTLDSIRQMIEVSLANGTTPVLVGVSELYGSQNSKTGNIAGYIDPGAEQRATQINDGIAALARQYGVTFTDVRSAVSAGSGDLLDGVHSNADFGKKMADAISESIVQQNAITGVNVPQLPANVASLSAQEKGRLYNDLISQGYSDAQIRTAAKSESDADWNALRQVAAEVKNIPVSAVETQAGGTVPNTNFSGIFSQGQGLADQAQQVLAASGKANDPRFADAIVGSFTQNGVIYNVQGDGSIQGIIETPTGAYTAAGFTPDGQQVNEQFSNKFEQSSTDRLLGTLANAAIAAGTGIALGPAGIGLLGAPAATAIGSGVTTFANTGSVQDALKAAAIAGGAAYGVGQLLPTSPAVSEAQFIANDAAQLAKQGLSEAQISSVLQASGVSPSIATNVAAAAAEGLSPAQIIQDVGNVRFGTTTPTTASTTASALNPNQVVVTGQTAGTGALSNLSPLLSTVVPTATTSAVSSGTVATTPATSTVNVTEQRVLPENISQMSGVEKATVYNNLLAQGFTDQQVRVIAERELGPGATQGWDALTSLAASLNNTAATTAPPTQQTVTVAEQRVLPENIGQMSGVEKATLYNSLLAQGLTDQQVRVIAERELGPGATEGWDSLTSLAASLLNPPSTPTQTVNVQAQPAAQETPTAQETTGGLLGSTVTPTQSVNVSGERVLPENIENMSLTEKAAVYNNLLAQGLTDQQVRVITERELGPGATEGWEYLTQAAAQLGTVPATSQTVNVTADRPVTTQPETVAGTVISALTPSVPVGSQTVDVTGQREVTAEDLSVPINTFIPALAGVAPLTPNLPTPGAPAPNNSLFNPNDILKLLTTIGGLGLGTAAGGSGGGINMGTPPPSDPRLGTTTPQYGDDYYAAVQRYYDSYMPQYPRDVAGPLRQWYENKFGA
jgi:lysophospholipase L1-like esterase